MPLESCMILLDNSEYMRNGDYIPTRLEAQQDAANLLVGAKTGSHPESTVGVSAGTELLVSPTENVGKILRALHDLGFQSQPPNITAAVQVASLALKHRRNKNGAQRIVLFVGSPIDVDSKALQKAGRQLKKNNVSIDVVVLGEIDVNESKLRELVDAANGRTEDGNERTCHLVTIPAGTLPSDVLASSPILAGGYGGGAGGAAAVAFADTGGSGEGGDAFAEYGGIDPNMDPELAMALRVSMEEERARQERAAAANAAAQEQQQGGGGDAEMADAAQDAGISEEEALLQQALAMSMNENEPEAKQEEEDSKPAAVETMEMDEDEDAAMQMALQMSMQSEEGKSEEFQDPAFVNELLGSMPGVDPNDPNIQEALRKAKEKKDKEKKDEDKKE